MFLIVLVFLWLEGVVTALPLFLIAVLVMLILQKNSLVFVLAFLGGLILDVTAVRPAGGSSLFLVGFLFFILLYKRKYEIATVLFVWASSFFGSFLYLWFFGYGDVLMQALVGSIVGVLLFVILKERSAYQNL